VLLTGLGRCFLGLLLCLAGVMPTLAQSSAEYGAATSASGTATAKAKVPFPKMTLPTAKPGQGGATSPAVSGKPAGMPTADEAAASNRVALQRSAGTEAAETSLRSVPDHVLVWIDMRFVGATPIMLKLAPGRHRVRMSAPNLQPVDESVELAPKQPKEVLLSLTPRVAATASEPR
jgi:hypothetical protein